MKNTLVKSILALATTLSFATAHAQSAPGPHLIIYKTRKDYRKLVPVQLSADKKSIVAYPSPQDIKDAAQPTCLPGGYYLDNRGIDTNTAFISMTYSQYAKLATAPTVDKLAAMIKDRNPITQMCDCGLRRAYDNPATAAKKLVKDKQLTKKCTSIK